MAGPSITTAFLRRNLRVPLALAALVLGGGCGSDTGPQAPETDEPLFREAQELRRQGKDEQALNDYLKLIAQRGDQAPQSHLNVAILDLDTFQDPIAAIYHFREFLDQQPNSVQAGFVRGQIEAAKREFASTLPASSWLQNGPQPELAQQVQQLQAENAALKAQLAELRGQSGLGVSLQAPSSEYAANPAAVPPSPPAVLVPAPPPAAPPPAPAGHGGRVHVVVHGDGLMKLAREYYGSESRWRDIVAANPDLFPNGKPGPLKLGMRIKIP